MRKMLWLLGNPTASCCLNRGRETQGREILKSDRLFFVELDLHKPLGVFNELGVTMFIVIMGSKICSGFFTPFSSSSTRRVRFTPNPWAH